MTSLLVFFLQPRSTEPINGTQSPTEDDDDETDDVSSRAHSKDGRSVSSTIHDRAKASSTTNLPNQASRNNNNNTGVNHNAIARANNVKAHHRRASSQSRGSGSGSSTSSTHTARETFMNYFFGQNGPPPNSAPSSAMPGGPPISGSGAAQPNVTQPSGRELAQSPAPMMGLIAGRRPDGSNAAFDMKSLGKHIEAVSSQTHSIFFHRHGVETYP